MWERLKEGVKAGGNITVLYLEYSNLFTISSLTPIPLAIILHLSSLPCHLLSIHRSESAIAHCHHVVV